MSQRLKRIVRKVDGKPLQKRRDVLPPRQQLIKEAHILRKSGNPKALALANAFLSVDEMIFGGSGTVRTGGGAATKPIPLPKELEPYREQWKRPPPENPGEK
jgi:hypothetical protein